MNDKGIKFVVKIIDKTYNSWAYINKELREPWGHYGYFKEEDCFKTIEEANIFIKDLLKDNRWRPEVNETWFEVVSVYFTEFFNEYIAEEILERNKIQWQKM